MGAPIDVSAEYERLRLAYDSAFQVFRIQVRIFQSLLQLAGPLEIPTREAREDLAEAEEVYRRSRDRLAEHVLAYGAPPVP
jgi:hypothetical protein